ATVSSTRTTSRARGRSSRLNGRVATTRMRGGPIGRCEAVSGDPSCDNPTDAGGGPSQGTRHGDRALTLRARRSGDSSMAALAADRDLLFGLLALQNGLINQGQLVAAFQAWTLDKSRNLADHLEARGDLTAAKRALLESLAAVHLEAHGGDAEKSLAATAGLGALRGELEPVA